MKPAIKVVLCSPRGFCAGVDRAIQIVEKALARYGPPVYVRHEIVHNRYVVDELRQKGAVFVEDLDEIPADTSAPVIFSAHGVPKATTEEAERRGMFVLDATCPLVSKVHAEAVRHRKSGKDIILIGHKGHPEVVGTMGQLADGEVMLVETLKEAKTVSPDNPDKLAYITQTTLSVDDTQQILQVLGDRFPSLEGPPKEDICYATTNRQAAVQNIARKCDVMLVVGAPNSSNSKRLVEVAQRSGCHNSVLVQRADDICWEMLQSSRTVGITAGASAPEVLVDEIIDALSKRYDVTIEALETVRENVAFKLPKAVC